jgi:hypothetical protein
MFSIYMSSKCELIIKSFSIRLWWTESRAQLEIGVKIAALFTSITLT